MADHDAGHLDEATWDRLAANELSPSERDRYFDHVTSCADCTRVWRGVLTLKSEAEARGLITAAAVERPWWRTQMVALAAAASVLLAVAGFFVTLRTDVDSGAVRGNSALPPVERLDVGYPAGGTPQFTWTVVPGTTKYRVDLFTEDGAPLWSGEVAAPTVSWPATVPRQNGRYRWRVEAVGANGPIARSRLTPFEIGQ